MGMQDVRPKPSGRAALGIGLLGAAMVAGALLLSQLGPTAVVPDQGWRPRALAEAVAVPDANMKPLGVVDGTVLYTPAGGGGGLGVARPAPAYVRVSAGRYLPVDR